MDPLTLIPVTAIEEAGDRISDSAIKTPLLPLELPDSPCEIWLKAECLQPIGSFKLRGALNAMRAADPDTLKDGVWTASAGNMAQGVAWGARRLGIKCTVVVPDNAATAQLNAITELGASIIKIHPAEWFDLVLHRHQYPGLSGLFIHPASDRRVMAGQGTIGIEIVEDLPDVDAVVTPFGAGGLTAGVASAVQALKPETRRYACELETGAPLAPSLEAGEPVTIETRPAPGFATGFSGAPTVAAEMWPILSRVVDGSLVMSVADLVAAIRLLVERNHVVAEGAGAAAVASALAGGAGDGRIACVVSGGHIDPNQLIEILGGEVM